MSQYSGGLPYRGIYTRRNNPDALNILKDHGTLKTTSPQTFQTRYNVAHPKFPMLDYTSAALNLTTIRRKTGGSQAPGTHYQSPVPKSPRSRSYIVDEPINAQRVLGSTQPLNGKLSRLQGIQTGHGARDHTFSALGSKKLALRKSYAVESPTKGGMNS